MFGGIPVILTLGLLVASFRLRSFAFDFHGDLYSAGRAILDGHNPYQFGFLEHLAAVKRTGGELNPVFAVPVYPAPALLAAVPLSVLPFRLAGGLFVLINAASLVLALRLLGVRDWRCTGVAFLAFPVEHGLMLGAIDGILVLAGAAVWRWRACVWPPATALAVLVGAKLFAWPVALWMLITRRWRAFGLAALLGSAGVLGAWAVVGFSSISQYPKALGNLSFVLHGSGVSMLDFLADVGVPYTLARVASIAVTGALLAAAGLIAQRSGEERTGFGLAVMACLTASPIVWPHYLALVFIPIALVAPRFSPLWLVPLLGYLYPAELSHGQVWRIIPYLAIEVIVIASLLRSKPFRAEILVSPLLNLRSRARVTG